MENTSIDTKRILIFLAITFAYSWAGSLVMYLAGGITDSQVVFGGFPLYLGIILVLIMPGPAVGHFVTRIITKEGWKIPTLEFKLRREWAYWLMAWFGTPLLVILGAAIFYALNRQFFDPTLSVYAQALEASGQNIPFSPFMLAAISAAAGIFLAPVLNVLPILGEEFGWRAYLQPKLMPLGGRWAVIITGLIWGIWHAPIILMGYNYGFEYPGAPYLGVLAMTWFTLVLAVPIGWLTIKAGSFWPAVIVHGSINGVAGLAALFLQGQPNPLLGPLPVGVIGGAAFALVSVVVLVIRGALVPLQER